MCFIIHWFAGWVHSNFYNSQPSDDGLANQDCVEIRRDFRYAAKGLGLADHYYWNDRDCRVANPYFCEKLKTGVVLDPYPPDCNKSVTLSLENRRVIVSSPGYPEQYPKNIECYTKIHAPHNSKIILTFMSFNLEDDMQCHYDYVELSSPSGLTRRYCGNWNSRLKLLRYISTGNVLQMLFKSDYSHSFVGFRAEVALYQGNDVCDDPRLYSYGNKCYLFISYPEVTWYTARKICREMQGQLSSVGSQAEQNFIIDRIKKMETYTSGTLFWLGGFRKLNHDRGWQWVDSSPFNYSAYKLEARLLFDWYPDWMKEKNEPIPGLKHQNKFAQESCLAFQWKSVKDSRGRLKYSGLYWESQTCEQSGGYICKKNQIALEASMNSTVYGHKGNLTSINYPANYPNNLDYTIRVIGPIGTRILLQFNYLDLEWQEDCLYDYMELRSGSEKPQTRVCGQHSTDLMKFDFISDKNELVASVHTDYSITGTGFDVSWTTVDVSSCPSRFTNVLAGKIQSVNYPSNYISNLDCVTEIFTNPGSRVWLEFLNFDVGTMNPNGVCQTDFLELTLGRNSLEKILLCGNKTDDIETLKFLSFSDYIKVFFHSDSTETHLGYLAFFKIVEKLETTRIIYIQTNQSGTVPALNLLLSTPSNVSMTNKLIAPLGYIIHLQISQVLFNPSSDFYTSCPRGVIQIEDAFRLLSKPTNLCAMQNDALGEQVTFISYFNTIYVRQLTFNLEMIGFDVSFSLSKDFEFVNKTLALDKVENVLGFCDPNPCLHDGICNSTNGTSRCMCKGYHTGLFCHLTKCDLNPCIFGTCNLTHDDFRCVCNESYGGRLCEKYLGVCASRPCGDGGKCTDVNNTVVCTCYVWWEGLRCEHRVFKIPYKPLSRRMLEEPFWLGLITVSIVLLVLGCIWCIKRKFADKFERFLTEEIERRFACLSPRVGVAESSLQTNTAVVNISYISSHQQRGRSSSINKLSKLTSSEQLATSPQPASRSLLSRLGRSRKHSMLNLDPHSKSRRYQENRSFSFDDLLRKGSPRRRSHAILSGPGGSGTEEATKDILQSLVSPVPKLHRRMSLEEFIQLSEQKMNVRESAAHKLTQSAQTLMNSSTEETSFSNLIVPTKANTKVLKKKVSFAKCVENAAEVLANQNSENETFGSTSSISQTIISDSEETTSGDDVPLDVRNFSTSSSTSSSSESPVRRIQFQDDSSSYPLVIVHQPPPDIPPKMAVSSLAKSTITNDYDSAPEEVKVMVDDGKNVEEVELDGEKVQKHSEDDSKNSTVFRCLQSLVPDNNPKTLLNDSLLHKPVELETSILLKQTDDTDKLHAIDDLAEAFEKNEIHEVSNANRLQIPIFAMHDTVRPFRKTSFDGSMVRIPENYPRRLSVDAALLPSSATGKSPFGIPFHHYPLSKSPKYPRSSSQQMFASKRLKSKPPPLQIPKLIQAESHMTAMTNRSDKPTSHAVVPPIITISNISPCDSDIDSPNRITSGAQYLSPYVFMGATDDYMCTSLSNLSSSGYSSMNSPIASRCSSNNPLFTPSESDMEQPLTPRQSGGIKPYTKAGFLCPPIAAFHQPRNPNFLVDRTPSTSSREVSPPSGMSSPSRKRSSSETTDDLVDEFAEDEGIGFDQNADKACDVSDAIDMPVKDSGLGQGNFPPVIVVQPDQNDIYWQNLRRPSFERTLSPVSSRSESPVSERGDHLSVAAPNFTDSDGPGSEVPANALKPPSGKRQVSETTKPRKPVKRISPKRRTKGTSHAAERCSSSSESSSSPTAQKCLLPSKPSSSPLQSAISNRGPRKKFLLEKGHHNQHAGKKILNQSNRSLSSEESPSPAAEQFKKQGTFSEDDVVSQSNAKLRKPNFKDAIPCMEQQSHLLDDKSSYSSSSSSSSMTTTIFQTFGKDTSPSYNR
uniref:Cubilin n=1 Tax=Strigamia maritima TaxID=126957 RepID=T1J517_STRMM